MMKDLLIALINQASVKDNVEACNRTLELIFDYVSGKAELRAEWFERNGKKSLVLHNAEPGQRHFELILAGHTDVVPGPDWIFTAKEKDGKIWGRGASDMKGVDVAMVQAFVEAVSAGLDKKVALMLTTDEEIGGFDGVGYLVEEEGFRADFVFLPDSGQGDWQICTDEKGSTWLRVEAKGKTAHGSRPWLGENALDKLIAGYAEVKKEFEARFGVAKNEEDYIPTLNLGVMQGGKVPNSVPEDAFMRLDVRIPGDFSEDAVLQPIFQQCEQLGLQVQKELVVPANSTPADHPLIASWAECAEARGIQTKLYKSAGASDARFFSVKGMPVMMTKPSCSAIHIDDEWIDMDDLERFKDVLVEWMRA